jgi:ATP-dependent helicase Lhr and Lhr-like helicase
MVWERLDPRLVGWFERRLGPPTETQQRAWKGIASGNHLLLAAPTGSGKTMAAFAWFLSEFLQRTEVPSARDEHTRLLYISPLKALSNDIGINLLRPIEELRAAWPDMPDIQVAVRTGDTSAKARAAMGRRRPEVLVTTPESAYILLTSAGGREMLKTVRAVIVDEIHALAGNKRGAHLALSLERLEALVEGPLQRIGLSATQKPIEAVARLLVGVGRDCQIVDAGHRRELELSVEVPPSPLSAVQSHEVWGEVHDRIAELVKGHRSTLVFVNTRKVCERTARELARRLGEQAVSSHHSSLSLARRSEAEGRLKRGELRALVATSSLELGIDVGEIDLVVQVGSTRTIATFLQRVGRSGHGVGRRPKGVLFPQSLEELTEAAALLLGVRNGALDQLLPTRPALDILAQQIVAECVTSDQPVEALFQRLTRAAPYQHLPRERFQALIDLHSGQRRSLLHFDATTGLVRATRRARLIALTSGGAIPDKGDYRVILEPAGTPIGSVDEDFAIESSAGDVFQLGNMSWRVLRTEPGIMRVVDAEGALPNLPFWFGETPARSAELSALMSQVRERGLDPGFLEENCGMATAAAEELRRYLAENLAALGCLPLQQRLVIERFPDRSGGAQLVLHSLYGSRINKAFGLALRKRFCRHFGFELEAAANEESILISLGPVHSFPLEEVPSYLSPVTVGAILQQALLAAPLFQVRWRWNASRSLMAPRAPGGKPLPAPILRMRSNDLLAEAFPDAVACGENLGPGDIVIPVGHPLLDQTLEDCLEEALDLAGLERLLTDLRSGAIAVHCIERGEPSPMGRAAVAIGPYGFLDDVGLENRRVHAVGPGRAAAGQTGPLGMAAVEQVRAEAWPDPENAEELHETLIWMGFVTRSELEREPHWSAWIQELLVAGRVEARHAEPFGEHFTARAASQLPLDLWRARLEVLGPFRSDAPELYQLESEGLAVRVELADGCSTPQAWCHRRLHARILRLHRDEQRQHVRSMPFGAYLKFLWGWQGLATSAPLEGPEGVRQAIARLAGWEAPAGVWEDGLLRARLPGYRREWLDELGLSGEVVWGRLWGSAQLAPRAAPISLFPREQLDLWLELAGPVDGSELTWPARALLEALHKRGALFRSDLERLPGLLPSDAERGLDELIGRGLLTSDAFQTLRPLLRAPTKRTRLAGPRGRGLPGGLVSLGRFGPFRSLLPTGALLPLSPGLPTRPQLPTEGQESAPSLPAARAVPRTQQAHPIRTTDATANRQPDRSHLAWPVARILLERYGVLFRALLERERVPIPWRELCRALRLAELAGDVLGGRFVDAFAGEQFALPSATPALNAALRAHQENPSQPAESPHPNDPLSPLLHLLPGRDYRPNSTSLALPAVAPVANGKHTLD